MRVDAVVSQGFAEERGAGAAAVYAQYGSGRVFDVTDNHHAALVSLDESLLNVTGFADDWFNLEVRIQSAHVLHVSAADSILIYQFLR